MKRALVLTGENPAKALELLERATKVCKRYSRLFNITYSEAVYRYNRSKHCPVFIMSGKDRKNG